MPSDPLPVVTRTVSIEGETQTSNRGDTNPSGPEIVLSGALAGAGASGIVVSGTSNSLVRSLVIGEWDGAGIRGDGASQLTVTGCVIGRPWSDEPEGANRDGIVIEGGMSARIGGAGEGEGNVILANRRYGVHLTATAYALVYGNWIGVDASGGTDRGHGDAGVRIDGDSERCHVGGANAGQGNVIANNLNEIAIVGDDTSYHKVFGNWLGATPAGGARTNRSWDVRIDRGHHNEIGGTAAGEGNFISAYGSGGVEIADGDLNIVAGNEIGFGAEGDLPHGSDGVGLRGASSYNTVSRNTIHRTTTGILVSGAGAIRNTFTRNLIYQTLTSAIDLHGEAVPGNEGIAPPIVGAISAHVEGVACPLCTVEVFSANGSQAEVYEGSTTANASGEWAWAGTPDRPNVRATATDALGNTSELTECVDPLEPNDTRAGAREIEVNLPHGEAQEGFICHPADLDYFSFAAAAGDVITADLRVPHHYTLRLYDAAGHELASDGSAASLRLRRIVHNVAAAGEYVVRVEGGPADFDAGDNYRLAVAVRPLAPAIALWFDEGWLADTEVYKVIPDAGDLAGRTWVDVVADVEVTSSAPVDLLLTVTVPGDPWGPPEWARVRECTGCDATAASVDDRGAGAYRVAVHFDGDDPPYHRQLVMRFGISSGARVGDLHVNADARLAAAGEIIGAATSPELHVVERGRGDRHHQPPPPVRGGLRARPGDGAARRRSRTRRRGRRAAPPARGGPRSTTSTTTRRSPATGTTRHGTPRARTPPTSRRATSTTCSRTGPRTPRAPRTS